MDVSIIIVNYNTAVLLEDCIHSIKEQSVEISYEIIVVDNASADDSVSMLETTFPEVILIKSPENIGFGKANNLGVKQAEGNYVLLLNTDILLINNAVKILFDYMESPAAKDTGACGGNLYHQNLQPNFSYSTHFPSLWNIFLYRSQLLSFLKTADSFNTSGKVKEVAIIIGADLMMHRSFYEQLGGFDPDYFMYIEDGDLAYRIKKNHKKSVSVPEARIIHLQGKSSTSAQKLIMELKGYILYFNKHYGSFVVNIYLIEELFFAMVKFIIFVLLGKKDKAGALKNFMAFIYLKKWKTN